MTAAAIFNMQMRNRKPILQSFHEKKKWLENEKKKIKWISLFFLREKKSLFFLRKKKSIFFLPFYNQFPRSDFDPLFLIDLRPTKLLMQGCYCFYCHREVALQNLQDYLQYQEPKKGQCNNQFQSVHKYSFFWDFVFKKCVI